MIDERRGRGSKSKKVDGEGELDQKSKKIFSRIKTQTFTKLKSAFIFSIKRVRKLISKGSICCAILTRLAVFLHQFLPQINSILSSRNHILGLKNQQAGYVLILVLATIPVLLLGAKWVLDQRTLDKVSIQVNQVNSEEVINALSSQNGSKAALAVAQNWNPGLTLMQQKDAVYKIADAASDVRWVLNVRCAIPGLDVPQYKVDKQHGLFEPLQIREVTTSSSPDSSEKLVEYIEAINFINRRSYKREKDNKATWNPNYALWRSIDVNTRPQYRQSKYDEIDENAKVQGRLELIHHDIYKDPLIESIGHVCKLHDEVYYPNDRYHSNSCCREHSSFVVTSLAQGSANAEYSPTHYDKFEGITEDNYSSTATKYKARPSLNPDPVEISISENDSIKVTSGDNAGYAEPARCNVDIVLAIPVNGAANNVDNKDAASDTAGTPLEASGDNSSIPDSVKNTPIYQMGQACKEFVKKHFYHTRGISMGLIPYSAKVSLSPDKVSYTTAITPFNSNTTLEYQQKMIGSCLYSTSGVRGANLTQGYKTTSLETNQTLPTTDTCYYWGGMLTGCPIMCRRGILDGYTDYSGNYSARGLLLDTTDAKNATDNQYKFMRMNLNPCYMGYANLLSMQCERQCTHFLPNPYYMIEPTADMVKIYEMCNALYPIYDKQNVSNFIFIPLEWTLNFWQSWTDDPGKEKMSGEADTSTLSVPSKMGEGRKKALVLIVNKPDWFEPGELTYLGFDNDAAEIPMAESDKIDFSIDYSDTTKQFLDGTNYNTEYTSGEFKGIKNKNSDDTPLVAGPKKIIKYQKISGNMAYNSDCETYEDEGTSQIRLKIPRPAPVKITVVSRNSLISKNWRYYPQALNPSGYTSYTYWAYTYLPGPIAYKDGRFVIAHINSSGCTAYSDDGGITWNRGNNRPSECSGICTLTANDEYFVGRSSDNYVSYSSDGINWHGGRVSGLGSYSRSITWNGNELVSSMYYIDIDDGVYTTTDKTGMSGWSNQGSSTIISDYEKFAYGGGYYVKLGYNKSTTLRSSTSARFSGYTSYTLPFSRAKSLGYGPGYWVILTQYGDLMQSTDASASSWKLTDGSSSDTTSSSLYKLSGKTDWCGICYGGGNWVAYTTSGDVAVTKVKTTNSTTIQSNSLPSTSAYTISGQTTFTVDPSKITETDDEGNYIIDFTCTNLMLISAEVTNCIVSTVNPINVTYKDADFDGSNGVLDWDTRSEAEAARTINVANGGTVSTDGYGVEMTDSTGKLKIASDQLKYVNGYGWVPKHANQDVLLKITSNHGGALTLNVGKWDNSSNSTVTFYSDNIGSTYNIREDSTSGTSISFGTAQAIQTISGEQTFVFSGGSMPTAGTSFIYSPYLSSSQGANFSHNLSVKKVKYSLSNASITSCVLKNQILRDYYATYGRNVSSKKQLILNDNTLAKKSDSDTKAPYAPYETFGTDGYPLSITVGDDNDKNVSKFRDSCVISYGNYSVISMSNFGDVAFSMETPFERVIHGVYPNFVVSFSDYGTNSCSYYASSGYISSNAVREDYGQWSTQGTCSSSSGHSDQAVRLKFSSSSNGGVYQYYVQNTVNKTLQNTEATAITTNPIEYQDLIENKGIYLANYNGENWICFQGDGELHVTVQSRSSEGMDGLSEDGDGLYYVKYNTTQTNVTSDSQDYSATWYSSSNDYYDSYCDSDGPLYSTYILLHNVYLKSVTQAAGNKTVRILRSTKQQDIKLVVGPNTTDGFMFTWTGNTSYGYMRQGVTYGDGMFVLVGGYDSSGNGSFYAIGDNNHTYVSTPDAFKGVAYDEDDKYFYAVTASGKIYRANKTSSNTLSSWSSYVSEGCPISGINRIACGNGHIVVQNTSAQSATYNKASGTWSEIVRQPATCYALCFGAGKFICMSYSTSSTVYSSPDGSSWTRIGSTTFRSSSYKACSVCYGNGIFLATDQAAWSINISTDGGSTWNRVFTFDEGYSTYDICYGFNGFFGMPGGYNFTNSSGDYCYLRYFYPRLLGSEYKSDSFQVKIGSRTPQQITSRTVFTIAASELTWDGSYYYVDVNIGAGYRRHRTAITDFNSTMTVDDLIDFNSGERSEKNGILTMSGSMTADNGFYVASGTQTAYSPFRGRFELRYARSLTNNNTGIDTSTIQKTSMTHSNGRYYYNWNLNSSYVLLYLRFYHEPEMLYPYGFGNSLNLDWRDNTLGIPTGLSVSSRSGYNTGFGYHQLDTSSCSPTMYRKYATTHPYTSDISAVLEARNPLLANITMPEYTKTSYLNGVTRLFSQQKRDSARTYSQLQPNSTTYNNTANLISTNFTVSQNRVLTANGYQSSGETPTNAVSDVTAAACTKLKNTYGNNLRIYVVKYKAQEKYNSFPYKDKASTATDHDYTTVDNCASSSSYLYSASTPDELNEALNAIATDIKSASFGNWQEAQNVE